MQSQILKEHINNFIRLLETVPVDFIPTSSYPGKYLHYLLEHKEYFTKIYADVISKLIYHSGKTPGEIILIDYGAGNGILGLFAKYAGFKKVIIVDIDPKFIEAAEKLSHKLNIHIEKFIAGNSSDLMNHFRNEMPDAIVGTDVIEHIYSLPDFFQHVRELNPSITSVFTTASNPSNFFKVKQLRKLQVGDELKGGSPEDSILFGENAHPPYLEMREKIISDSYKLQSEEIKKLARNTRGLKSEDIHKAVAKYLSEKQLPVALPDPYNTCNPLTGSWTERILTIKQYEEVYKNAGFEVNLYPGLYDENVRFTKRLRNRFLNFLIRLVGKKIAPYILLAGFKK